MVTYEPRSAWGARPSRGGVALSTSAVIGEALHWPGMDKPIDATGDIGKRRVASALRGWQNYHMDTKGWSDIAYQIAIDQAGRAWTLRGLNIRSGANGDATVNKLYGAFLLILAPGEQPSAAMKKTVQGVIADFQKRFPKASATPKGHRDVRAEGTDCPGDLAYAAIRRGDFTPGKITEVQEDDMPLTAADITAIRAAVQAEIEEYAARFWVASTGTGTAIRTQLTRMEATIDRIEDDTDDGTVTP
jgi:hypothetical protein